MSQNTQPHPRALADAGEEQQLLHHRGKAVLGESLLPPPPPPSAAAAAATTKTPSTGRVGPSLMDLPTELHILISQELIYPDALSLKHTSRHFYDLTYTGLLFFLWLLMQRRREHVECDSRPGLGCLVFGTPVCTHRQQPLQRIRRWLKSRLTIELQWLLLAAALVVLCWMWLPQLSAYLAPST
uniref:F-box domain-containing protein n=1 Tax=Pyricularia oryzae (strain P131) TaxID=1143193 RepID=L7ISN1_PYRO1